jgi:hypothetical protein
MLGVNRLSGNCPRVARAPTLEKVYIPSAKHVILADSTATSVPAPIAIPTSSVGVSSRPGSVCRACSTVTRRLSKIVDSGFVGDAWICHVHGESAS